MSEFAEMKALDTWYAQLNIDAIESAMRKQSCFRFPTWLRDGAGCPVLAWSWLGRGFSLATLSSHVCSPAPGSRRDFRPGTLAMDHWRLATVPFRETPVTFVTSRCRFRLSPLTSALYPWSWRLLRRTTGAEFDRRWLVRSVELDGIEQDWVSPACAPHLVFEKRTWLWRASSRRQRRLSMDGAGFSQWHRSFATLARISHAHNRDWNVASVSKHKPLPV